VSSPDDTLPADPARWRVVDAVLAFAGGFVAASIAFLVVGPDPSAALVFGVLVPVQSLGMVTVLGVLARRRQPWREAFRWSTHPSDSIGLFVGMGLQLGLSIVAALVAEYLLRREAPTQELVDVAAGASTGLDWMLVVVAVVIVGPLAEEVVFRGVVLRALEPRGRRVAVYGSAALFALVHLFDPNTLIAVPLFFILGVVLGNEVLRTGRLGRAFAIHSGFNLMGVIALYAVSAS
jgi:uncharacterized protein